MTLRAITPALLVVGVAVMVPFEQWYTLTLGVILLLAFVACGVALIANPEDLAREEDDEPTRPG